MKPGSADTALAGTSGRAHALMLMHVHISHTDPESSSHSRTRGALHDASQPVGERVVLNGMLLMSDLIHIL